jgi:hypothetical protein
MIKQLFSYLGFILMLISANGKVCLASPNHAPFFTGNNYITVCINSINNATIDSALAIIDSDLGQTETWTLVNGPLHGVLHGFPYSSISNSGLLNPSGFSYTDTGGYTGLDSFSIKISDGTASAVKEVYVTIDSFQAPSVTISANPGDTMCAEELVTLTAYPVYGGSNPSFYWIKNGVNLATGSAYTYQPETGNFIYCILSSDYPCRTADSVNSNMITMRIEPILTPSVTITAYPGFNIIPGINDSLVGNVIDGGVNPTFQWEINGVYINGATESYYVSNAFSGNDTVTCNVTSSGLCQASGFTRAVVQVSAQGGTIDLYPNPNNGAFTLRGNVNADNNNLSVAIFNTAGQRVYDRSIPVSGTGFLYGLSLADYLPGGLYFIRLTGNSVNSVMKFTVGR